VDNEFQQLRANSLDAVIDLWGTNRGTAFPTRLYTNDTHFPKGVWSFKEDRINGFTLSCARQGVKDGKIYNDDVLYGVFSSFKPTILEEVTKMKVKQKTALLKVLMEKIKNDTYFTESQKSYIEKRVQQVDTTIKQKFKEAYLKWNGECLELSQYEGLNIHTLESCRDFKSIDKLKALGKETVPLYIEILAHGTDILPLVPYNEIQEPALQSHAEDGNIISYSGLYQTVHAVDLWLAANHE